MTNVTKDALVSIFTNAINLHATASKKHLCKDPRNLPIASASVSAEELCIDNTDDGNSERIRPSYDEDVCKNVEVSEERDVRKSIAQYPTVNINCINCIKSNNQEYDSKSALLDISRLARSSFCFRRLTRRCCFVFLVLLLYWASLLLCDDELARHDDKFYQSALRDWVAQNEALLRSEYRQRAETARAVCDKLGFHSSRYNSRKNSKRVSLKRVNWEYMYWARKEGLLYCKVPKSGSSTWVYNLLRLAGVPNTKLKTDIGLHKMLRNYYPRPRSKDEALYRRSLKLLVVRHPFDRILSAYRDKLESYERDLLYRNGYYHKMYGRNIVRAHRNFSGPSHGNRSEPTWREFVSYLLSTPTSHYDEHWRPIHLMCPPCASKYDVIAKMETFNEDTQYVIHQLGLEDRLSVEWIHASGSSSSADIAKTYYSQLTREQVLALYEKYRLDFELFAYDAADHIQASRTSTTAMSFNS
ncbi:Sulfotransferase [Trinorchestia longiramus]|nr:Sulfotransferase [Trinorchestia longiramus]